VDHEGVAIEELAQQMAPTDKPLGLTSEFPVNSGPQQHYVLAAALSHLDRWARGGSPPPKAQRLASKDAGGRELLRDELGIARGGIRTPWVDAPSCHFQERWSPGPSEATGVVVSTTPIPEGDPG